MIDNEICVIVDDGDACAGVLFWAGVTPRREVGGCHSQRYLQRDPAGLHHQAMERLLGSGSSGNDLVGVAVGNPLPEGKYWRATNS